MKRGWNGGAKEGRRSKLFGGAIFCAILAGALALIYYMGGGRQFLALASAPAKPLIRSSSELAKKADQHFWTTLHAGQYDDLPATIDLLTAAFMENPHDPDIARRLAFSHAWRLVERNRMPEIPVNISEHAFLSEHYYSESYALDPSDHRTLGAVAILKVLNGVLMDDERKVRQGYFMSLDANKKWPQFNYFTTGTAMATLPYTDQKFIDAVDWQWKLLESCNSEQDFKDNLSKEEFAQRYPGVKRVCWDSEIAPHNMEGTLLHMGDMLVKSGDWKAAIDIYKKIKGVRYYESWPLKEFLDERIKNAEANVAHFRVDYTKRLTEKINHPTMLLHSGYYCVSCHQTSGTVPPLGQSIGHR